MSDDSAKPCFISFLCLTIILGIIFGFSMYTDYELSESYLETQCNVTNISYPKNYSDKQNWAVCRCGRYCEAYSPVIKIYVDVRDVDSGTVTNRLLNKDMRTNDYTFFDYSCPDAKKPDSIDRYLEASKKIYESFNNRTLPCFYNNIFPYPILTKYEFFENLLNCITVAVLGCCCMCTCCQGMCNFNKIFG